MEIAGFVGVKIQALIDEPSFREAENRSDRVDEKAVRAFRNSGRAAREYGNDVAGAAMRAAAANDNLAKSVNLVGSAMRGAMALFGAAFSANQLIEMTSAWTDLNSRVEIATGSLGAGAATLERLSEMARRTYSSLELTAESFLLNAQSMSALGYSTNQTLDYVESINNALVVSGAKGDRAASVMNALSKAMALGKLSGDELNTVISVGGRVAQALADSMGVSVLELRALGAAGKITGREIFGIAGEMEKLRREAESMPATINDAFTLLGNSILKMVGTMDEASDSSSRTAEAIIWVADNIENAIPVAAGLASVLAVSLIPSIASATLSFGSLTLAMLANPFVQVALVAGTLAGAMVYLNQQQGLAAQAAQTHAEALTTNANAIETAKTSSQGFRDGLRSQIELQMQAAEAALNEAGAQYKAAEARAATAEMFNKVMNLGANILGMPGDDRNYGETIMDKALAEINTSMDRLNDLRGQLDGLADVEANYEPVVHSLSAVGGAAQNATQSAKTLGNTLSEAARDAQQAWDFYRQTFSGFFQDLKGGLTEGKTLWESLGAAATNALDGIASRTLNMAANGIFDMIFGSLMGGFSAVTGGSMAGGFVPGLTGPRLFSSGGYTGDVPTGSLAGLVHGQEYVLNAAATRSIGLPALNAMNAGIMPASVAAPANSNGGTSTVIIQLADGLRAEIIGEANANTVKIVQANDKAHKNYRQNGGN